jgi:hypothetical protein
MNTATGEIRNCAKKKHCARTVSWDVVYLPLLDQGWQDPPWDLLTPKLQPRFHEITIKYVLPLTLLVRRDLPFCGNLSPPPPPRQPPVGQGLLIHEVSRLHTTTHHSRWDSSGGVISLSLRPLPAQPATLTTDRHPCPRWDSKPQSQQTRGRRPSP